MKKLIVVLPLFIILLCGCGSSKTSILSNKFHEDRLGNVFIFASVNKNDKLTAKLVSALQESLRLENIESTVYIKNALDLATEADIAKIIKESGATHRINIELFSDLVLEGGLDQKRMMNYIINLHNLSQNEWTWSGSLATNVKLIGSGQLKKAATVIVDKMKSDNLIY